MTAPKGADAARALRVPEARQPQRYTKQWAFESPQPRRWLRGAERFTAIAPQYHVDTVSLGCTRWTEGQTEEQVSALRRTR